MKRNPLHALVLVALALFLTVPWLPLACKTPGKVQGIEDMSEADFGSTCAKVEVLSQATFSILIREGKLKREDVLDAVSALEFALSPEGLLVGPNIVTHALKSFGLKDAETLLAVLVLDTYLSKYVDVTAPVLSTRTREIVLSVVGGMRAAVTVGVTPQDEQAAAAIVEGELNAR